MDLATGVRVGGVSFEDDLLPLHHNQGASLWGDTLAVLSLRRQAVHLYTVTPAGTLELQHSLGPECAPDDGLVLRLAGDAEARWAAGQAAAAAARPPAAAASDASAGDCSNWQLYFLPRRCMLV